MDIKELRNMIGAGSSLLHDNNERLFRIHQFAKCSKGACAELGVWMGGSSKIIAKSTQYQVNIFDTFEGLPMINKDIDKLSTGEFPSNFETVKKYLSDCNNIRIFRGFFPDSASEDIEDIKYGFVHLDGDLYSSTLDGLQYFYPKMLCGGVIMTDDWDYDKCPGVNKAFYDFGVNFVNIGNGQCIIIK